MEYTYKSEAKPAMALSIGDKVGIVNGYVGVVTRSDGKEVWRGNNWSKKQRAVLESNRSLAGFRAHYAKTGRCWFDDEEAKRKAKIAWKNARNAITQTLFKALCQGVDARVAGDDLNDALATFGYLGGSERAAFEAGYEAAAILPDKPEAK